MTLCEITIFGVGVCKIALILFVPIVILLAIYILVGYFVGNG